MESFDAALQWNRASMMMINPRDSWGQWWSSRSLLSSDPACHVHDEDICAISGGRRRRRGDVSVPSSTRSSISSALTSQPCSLKRDVMRADSRRHMAWYAESNLTGKRQWLMDGWKVSEWPVWRNKSSCFSLTSHSCCKHPRSLCRHSRWPRKEKRKKKNKKTTNWF